MAKSTHLGLELTDPAAASSSDSSVSFTEWWKAQNADNSGGTGNTKSNAELVDEFAGKFAGGAAGQILSRTGNGFAWINAPLGAAINADAPAGTSYLAPNTYYTFTNVSSVGFSLLAEKEGIENEYKGQFTTATTVGTIAFPNSITWIGGLPTFVANKTYVFSIVNNIGICVGV